MPAKSKRHQRLFGWALSCQRGTSDNCPTRIQKLADSMSAEELEKFAGTSHKDLPESMQESLDSVIEATIQLLEAELGIDLETYEYETDVNEAKALKVEQPAGKPLSNAKPAEATKKLSDAKPEKSTLGKQLHHEIPDAKQSVEGGKNEIPHPAGKEVKADKEDPTASVEGGVEKKESPSVDNKKDEPDHSWDKVFPGMQKASGNVMGNVYTPSIHKFPMSTNPKNDRRIYDFDGFLKIINYKTHDGILQTGHGQNLTGN
jgi:hypothetical protein